MQSSPVIRIMNEKDIGTGLSLCRLAGWNQVTRDWELFLRLSPNGCRVAVDGNEKIVGTVATIRYEAAFSWIGMVLVDPASRGQGLGTRLLNEALQILGQEKTVKLDATPAGRAVYLKLGFVDEYPLSRVVRKKIEPAGRRPESSNVHVEGNKNSVRVRPVRPDEIERIVPFDCVIFGANRCQLLNWLYEGGPQWAFLVEDQGQIQGYCLGRRGDHFTQIGPIVARDMIMAKALVAAALEQCDDQSVVLDIPEENTEWVEWLGSLGFMCQRPFMRMYKGPNIFPGIPALQFAITGPEFG